MTEKRLKEGRRRKILVILGHEAQPDCLYRPAAQNGSVILYVGSDISLYCAFIFSLVIKTQFLKVVSLKVSF